MNKNICTFGFYTDDRTIECKESQSPCLYQRYCTQDNTWWVSDEYGKCKRRIRAMGKNNKNRYNSPVEKNDSIKKIETIITEENIQSISEQQVETITPVDSQEIEKIDAEIVVNKVKVISNDGRTMMIKYPDGRYALIPATSAKNGDYIEI